MLIKEEKYFIKAGDYYYGIISDIAEGKSVTKETWSEIDAAEKVFMACAKNYYRKLKKNYGKRN